QLGAGKTTFTQGLAEGLDIPTSVNSPTFVLLKEYHGRLPLYHFDLYRLADRRTNLESTVSQEWSEFLQGPGLSVVEWADLAPEVLPPRHLLVHFSIESETRRTIILAGVGQRYSDLLASLDPWP
ncbi:MAG: tRNA (adenosine(37)-N6)-threonylcarbamoyltransferase complex ATPase subunit type 1 TsaE, partial [Chloroflexota bacterium]